MVYMPLGDTYRLGSVYFPHGEEAKSQCSIHRPGRTTQPARLQPGFLAASLCWGGGLSKCQLRVHMPSRLCDRLAGGHSKDDPRGTVSTKSHHRTIVASGPLRVQTLEVVSSLRFRRQRWCPLIEFRDKRPSDLPGVGRKAADTFLPRHLT